MTASQQKKRLSILGSTGSIGVNALKVVENLPDELVVTYLSGNRNAELLIQQAQKFKPRAVAVADPIAAEKVATALPNLEVLKGREGLLELAGRDDVDLVLNGLVGSAGMEPTVQAMHAGVNVALSNKESLVMAGDYIDRLLTQTGVKLYPVDSEHSAIWQCLTGEDLDDVERLILTGSGGPFRTRDKGTFNTISVEEALKHPNWDMGNKITIDSATMMNKGLEIIEARWLFHLGPEQLDIVVHPQSIIHSMVEFRDKSVKAQLGVPDMKIPIQYALTWPRHRPADWEALDLVRLGQLTFEAPDLEKFPCIELAFDALKQGGTATTVLNVANETAVYRFLRNEIKFTQIPILIERALEAHDFVEHPQMEDILTLESWTQTYVNQL
ncbi:MAG: 1-deoxy-D-xylulose-5-phosphate reductoisomerase [Candidatus Marinimicrobia bacterium]|nr:1-deoxy-D-xylulose-5-phosphate reductoisomerase [Candidatus Neomarinimicrobiota bacterium]MCF7839267.1 1-deoxy-D-xylulose-5-phosphate reductoisomerase [Candidatus Neomarinimicrobiota bacterium]